MTITNLLKEEMKLGLIGIEKENVRVDKFGNLALTSHPQSFGKKDGHPFIQADFSESQIEMITPPVASIEEAYYFLENIHDVIAVELEDEFLWPMSMPPNLPEDENEIPIAIFEDETAMDYRMQLAEKYGRKRQLISGVHANISFNDTFFELLGTYEQTDKPLRLYKDEIYLKMARALLKYEKEILNKLGASPIFHKSYNGSAVVDGDVISDATYTIPGLASLRNSDYGYTNNEPLTVSFSSLEQYINDLNKWVRSGHLQNEKEFYCPVRLKSHGDSLPALKEKGIDYLEVRLLDLDPFEKIGVSKRTLYFLRSFLLCAGVEKLTDDNIFEQVLNFVKKWELGIEYEEAINYYLTEKTSKAERIVREVEQSNFIEYNMNLAKKFKEQTRASQYRFAGADDLELSTQILLKEAIRKGVFYELLDRNDNFIALTDNNKTEYIKQATKTSLDSYSSVLAMENKHVTKLILQKHHVNVPRGFVCHTVEEVMNIYKKFDGNPIVIKPNSTNFGIGITILTEKYKKTHIEQAAQLAFSEDSTVLVEQFYPGKEYRFLVIDGEVVGVLHRVPANVTGDGVQTIRQLVAEKNKDPLRGIGYKTPLEKIKLGEEELIVLNSQGKTFDYVPNKDEIVYLRENSNISTGGDSIDFTDDVDESYNKIALNAVKALDVKMCGVDIIINDINEKATADNYVIIELNFNPAIHIHCFPYRGKNRQAGAKVLQALFPNL